MKAAVLLAFSVALAAPTQAQAQAPTRYDRILLQCYAAATTRDEKAACKGALSETCMQQEDGGYSTLGMTSCTYAETQIWDRFLNEEYQASMAWAKAMDASDKDLFPEFAKREENLRAAQRAWIGFRDAECGLAYAVWGAGSMRNIAASACIMDMTATRTLELFDLRDSMR